VSGLENVRHLNLTGSLKVREVSSLGKVHTLNLDGYADRQVGALGNVHNLNLRACFKVADASALRNVHILDLS
jgi:hypothetical protein